MKDKSGDFNFVLIFAIVAGISILILAIYGATKAGSTLQNQNEAELAKTIEIITDPLQAGFAESSTSKIVFNKETRISNDCTTFGGFGKNSIAVQTRSGIGEPWSSDLTPVSIHNKYIFSEYEQGKTFYVFSKPFSSPFKVADLLFVTSKNYCLVSPPNTIAEEILGLGVKNIGIETNINNTCKDNSTRVCFDASGCDIQVYGQCSDISCISKYDYGYVMKGKDRLTYSGEALLFGAIFSDKVLYECNVDRLLFRLSNIAAVLSQKADLMNERGCNTLLKPDMELLSIQTRNATSIDLIDLYVSGKNLDKKESREQCGLW